MDYIVIVKNSSGVQTFSLQPLGRNTLIRNILLACGKKPKINGVAVYGS